MAEGLHNDISLTISYRGTSYPISLSADDTLSTLQRQLEELTSITPSHQKLLYKGKRNVLADTSLAQAGLRNGMKVQMLGPTAQELGGMKATEDEKKKRDEIMRQRALKGPTKVRSTGSASSESLKFRFHTIEPLPHLPNPASAKVILERLADDPAIMHIMRRHEFSVGLLTELAPHEHPGLLGLNENAGQRIKLRIRTNAYDGFRLYSEIRKVLCHELTHNVWGDHDNDFKELNSKLNKEVAEFESAVKAGTHSLGTGGSVYEPSPALEADAHAHILGGNDLAVGSGSNDSHDERRRRILQATINRLRREEEELEDSCGTAGRSILH